MAKLANIEVVTRTCIGFEISRRQIPDFQTAHLDAVEASIGTASHPLTSYVRVGCAIVGMWRNGRCLMLDVDPASRRQVMMKF